jgi:CheY-like chemotaxis protein
MATILCIDDDEVGLQVRKMLLEQAGYQVLSASSGTQGLHIFRDGDCDLVLLDFFMPGMNGDEVAAAMKQVRPDTPIVLYSAYSDLSDDVLANVDQYVRKGGDPHYLLSVIEKALLTKPS